MLVEGSKGRAEPPDDDHPEDGDRAQAANRSSAFDIARYGRLVVGFITLIAGGIAVAQSTHLRALTQHGVIVAAAAVFIGAELWQPPQSVRESREQVGWLALWIGVAACCYFASPNIAIILPCAVLLWWSAFIQCECDVSEVRGGVAMRWLVRVRALLMNVVHWRTIPVAGAPAVATLAALAVTAGAFFSAVAEPTRHEKSPHHKGKIAEHPLTSKQSPKTSPKESSGKSQGGQEPASSFTCPLPHYSNAEWAVKPIQVLLRVTLHWLGEPNEGCVESLHSEYLVDHGFVWGVGEDPNSHHTLSIVIASYVTEPSLYRAPATTQIEDLIQVYHFLKAPKAFPHYRANEGDYYLVNTYEEGTCVLIRQHSGESEDLPFTILYPSVATAWALIIKLSKHWQWPTELPGTNDKGEVEFDLTQPGDSIPDAKITFNPKTLTAIWHSSAPYKYRRAQSNIDPEELEQDVRRYL